MPSNHHHDQQRKKPWICVPHRIALLFVALLAIGISVVLFIVGEGASTLIHVLSSLAGISVGVLIALTTRIDRAGQR